MSDGLSDKEAEVHADLIGYAIEGRRLGALDHLFRETELNDLKEVAEDLDSEFSWFRYNPADMKIKTSDVASAREKKQELRNRIYDY
jgi:hypothetical protein